MEERFLDPITLEPFDDPIVLPCCGRSVGRAALRTVLEAHRRCPMCNDEARIRDLDVETAPRNRDLCDAMEAAAHAAAASSRSPAPPPKAEEPPGSNDDRGRDWEVEARRLPQGPAHVSVLCHMARVLNAETQLLVLLLDKSGSMTFSNSAAPRPIDQCVWARQAVVAMATQAQEAGVTVRTVAYDHRFVVDPSDGQMLSDNGGTSFLRAFAGLHRILVEPASTRFSSVTVVLMTDGQCSEPDLFGALSRTFKECWAGRAARVHTVGFSVDHNFALLDSLRLAGTEPGVFQFADPAESNDALYTKLMAICQPMLAGAASNVMLQLPGLARQLPVRLVNRCAELWLDPAEADQLSVAEDSVARIVVGGQDAFEAAFTHALVADHDTMLKWLSHLADRILQWALDLGMQGERDRLGWDCHALAVRLAQAVAQAVHRSALQPAPDSSETSVSKEDIIARLDQVFLTPPPPPFSFLFL
jgi:hypothetical protein